LINIIEWISSLYLLQHASGPAHAHVLLQPLEQLAAVEESVVREKVHHCHQHNTNNTINEKITIPSIQHLINDLDDLPHVMALALIGS
jgi:hypothetical protein